MVYNQVQYVRFNTFGNTARKIVQAPSEKKVVLPKPRSKQKRKAIYVDPVAMLSALVAFCLLLTMTVGIVQFASIQREAAQLEAYVSELSDRNEILREEYEAGYDIDEVKESAMALGMVSKDAVQTVSIQVTVPQQEETVTLWERIGTFLTTLFA